MEVKGHLVILVQRVVVSGVITVISIEKHGRAQSPRNIMILKNNAILKPHNLIFYSDTL